MAGIFLLATVVLPFTGAQNASAATLTWTGGGNGTSFSDAANWSSASAPVDGDVVVFSPLSTGSDGQTANLTNDLSGVELSGLQVAWSDSGFSTQYNIDTMSFQGNPALSSSTTGSKYVTLRIEDSVQVAGNLNHTDSNIRFFGDVDVTGNLSTSRFIAFAPGSTIGGNFEYSGFQTLPSNMVIGGLVSNGSSNATLSFKGPSATIGANLRFNDVSGNFYTNQFAFGNCAQEVQGVGGSLSYLNVQCASYAPATYTLTGTITLNADLVIHVAPQSIVNITGTVVANGNQISLEPNSQGTLNVGESGVEIPNVQTSLDGDQPTISKTVSNKEVATLNGARGSVFVLSGGTIKGTGTARTIFSQGTVSPGDSPGTMTILETFSQDSSGILEMELLNSEVYDRLIVGESFSGGGSAVTVAGSLSTILFDGWSVAQGDQFRIIDNLSSTPVSGTFTGLPEGTQMVVDGITFSITYVGGDGNDVVLTAINSGTDPDAPNTGIAAFVQANPLVVVAAGLIGVVTLVIISKATTRQRA